jgi:hypothetical protein
MFALNGCRRRFMVVCSLQSGCRDRGFSVICIYVSSEPKGTFAVDFVEFVGLQGLMSRTQGKRQIGVALIDGPVALDHPDLAHSIITQVSGSAVTCSNGSSVACRHGTFVAGILVARRGAATPAICPGCTLIMRPIFFENTKNDGICLPRKYTA